MGDHMTSKDAFELIRDQEIAEINTRARLFRHRGTGAELLSLENDDENKVFGVVFRTPPPDSTGLPHILEQKSENCSREPSSIKGERRTASHPHSAAVRYMDRASSGEEDVIPAITEQESRAAV